MKRTARTVPNLTFHGKVPYLEIGRLFDRARLLANTSEIEGFPNTFLQAWVRGVPVVTMFDPDGLVARESLGSAHDTVSDMVRGLKTLLMSNDTYERASAVSLAFMEQRFGEDKVLGPYLEVLTAAKIVAMPATADARTYSPTPTVDTNGCADIGDRR